MIIRDIYGLADTGPNAKNIHDLIDESIATYPILVDERWRDYSAGRVRDLVSDKRKKIVGISGITPPQQNMIRQCIRQIVGRLRFKRFVVDGDPDKEEWLKVYATKNNFGRIAVGVGRRGLIDGNTALSQMWRDDGAGVPFVRQEYWRNTNGYGIFVAVDDIHNPVWAVSDYIDNDDIDWRVIYLPDRILTYQKGYGSAVEGEWGLFREDPFVDASGQPIGMPVSHFSNSDPDYGPYGTSTVGEIVEVQDALNLSIFNRMAVSALTGQQVIWGTGIKPPKAGDEIGPGKMLTSEDAASRFGAIPPGQMDGLLLETDDLRGVVSGAFPVPAYRLGSGDWPSGLALQRSDGPMITVVRLLRDVITPGLVHHAHRATKMSNAFAGTAWDTESLITIEWENLDELDPSTEAEILKARVEVLMDAESLTEVGMRKLGVFTEEEIKKILKDREEQEVAIAQTGGDGDI